MKIYGSPFFTRRQRRTLKILGALSLSCALFFVGLLFQGVGLTSPLHYYLSLFILLLGWVGGGVLFTLYLIEYIKENVNHE